MGLKKSIYNQSTLQAHLEVGAESHGKTIAPLKKLPTSTYS